VLPSLHFEAVAGLSKSLSDASASLREQKAKCVSLKAQLDKSRQRSHEEMESHRFSRDLLMKKGDEVNKLAAEVFRAQQGELKLKEQLKNTTARMEDNHKRLLEEMAKGSNATKKLEKERNSARAWVRERSKLLAQFCDEEQRLRQVTWSLRSDMQRSNRGAQSGRALTDMGAGANGDIAATSRAHRYYAGK
jgi:chromosome segregation ATPase